MTLQEMFIDIKYRHDGSGAKKAKRGITDLRGAVDNLHGALERVNSAFQTMSNVAVGSAVAGTIAYARFTKQIAESAGKAGLATREFRKMYLAESGVISRATGTPRNTIMESMQRAHSLGGNRRAINHVSRLAAILQSGGQAHAATAIESAFALQAEGFGTARSNIQRAYAAAQVGAGNVEDYFESAGNLIGIAKLGGVDLNDLLAILTIGSRGGSMSRATTRTQALVRSFARPAPKQTEDFFRERTGKDWQFLSDMQRKEGTLAAVRYIGENFKDFELPRLFTEVEAATLIKPLIEGMGDALSNRARIAGAPDARYIELFGKDVGKEFFNVIDRLKNAFYDMFKAIGRPWAAIVSPFLKSLTNMIDVVLRINDALGGLLAWIPALLTSLLLFKNVIIGILVKRLLQPLITGVGNMVKSAPVFFGRLGDRARAMGATASGQRVSAASGGAAKWFAGGWLAAALGNVMKPFAKVFDVLKALSTRLIMFAGFIKMAAIAMAAIAAVIAPFMLWSKFRSDKDFDPNERFGVSQTRYFKEGGAPGGEPAPSAWRDRQAQNRMAASARFFLILDEIGTWMMSFVDAVEGVLPKFIVEYYTLLLKPFVFILSKLDDLYTGIGEFFRELAANPGQALAGGIDWYFTKQMDMWASIFKAGAKVAGVEFSEDVDALGALKETRDKNADRTAMFTAMLPESLLKAAGAKGGKYANVVESPDVVTMPLESSQLHLATPQDPAMLPGRFNKSKEVIHYKGSDIVIHGDVEITDNRLKEIQRVVREENERMADLLRQEAYDPSFSP